MPQTILRQIILLTILSILTATIAFVVLTFQGPPPMPAPVSVTALQSVLAGSPTDGRTRSLVRTASAAAPTQPDGYGRNPALDDMIAARLGIRQNQVLGWYEETRSPPSGADGDIFGAFVIGVSHETGWIVVTASPPPMFGQWHLITFSAMAVILLVLIGVSIVIARHIVRPLEALAQAAQATAADGRGPAVPDGGPREVALLASAIDAMRGRLRATLASRTEMFTGIAHDIGTPLNRLSFRIEQLPEASRTAAVEDMDEMRVMLSDLLTLGRSQLVRRERVDAAAIAISAAASFGIDAKAEPLFVSGDATALKRLFSNLFDNAMRYAGGFAFACWVEGGMAEFLISDDGPGISPELLPVLFEPFTRADPSRAEDTGGNGLGLSIARHIAEDHGGQISVTNREGGGAEFRICLPLNAALRDQ